MSVFDMRTLMSFIALTHLMFGMLLAMHWRRSRDSRALLTWSVASIMAALAWSLIAARELVPDWLSIAVGNGVLITAWMVLLAGMRLFAGRSIRWTVALAPGAIVFVLFAVVPPVRDSLGVRVAVVNVALMLCLLLLVYDALRDQRREPLQARWIVVASVTVAVASNFARAVLAFRIDPGSSFLTSGPPQEIGVFVQGAALLGWSVGVLLMTRERLENQLDDSARRDVLTGVLNRRGFDDAAQRYLERSGSTSEVALLAVDLDRFKQVNDTHGHEVGDRLLRACAEALEAHLRPGELLGRQGGEEFCVLLPGSDVQEAERRAEALRQVVGDTYVDDCVGARVRVTASIGIAAANLPVVLADLQRPADGALYQAKRDGRDLVRVAAPAPARD